MPKEMNLAEKHCRMGDVVFVWGEGIAMKDYDVMEKSIQKKKEVKRLKKKRKKDIQSSRLSAFKFDLKKFGMIYLYLNFKYFLLCSYLIGFS